MKILTVESCGKCPFVYKHSKGYQCAHPDDSYPSDNRAIMAFKVKARSIHPECPLDDLGNLVYRKAVFALSYGIGRVIEEHEAHHGKRC